MRTVLFAALPALLPMVSMAESYRCQTAGYCTNSLECSPDDARFIIDIDKSGLGRFGWDEADATRFQAQRTQLAAMAVFDVSSSDSIQTLVLAENLQATFSVSFYFDGMLYTSIQALTCERT